MNSLNKTAKMAGVWYLLYIVTTIIADVFGRWYLGSVYECNRLQSNVDLKIYSAIHRVSKKFLSCIFPHLSTESILPVAGGCALR